MTQLPLFAAPLVAPLAPVVRLDAIRAEHRAEKADTDRAFGWRDDGDDGAADLDP